MVQKTISDSLAAIRELHKSLKALSHAARAIEDISQPSSFVKATLQRLVHDAANTLADTEDFVQPPLPRLNRPPADIGAELYGWIVTNASFNDQVQGALFKKRLEHFLAEQLMRLPPCDADIRDRIAQGFWDADRERFDNDAALGHDVKELQEVLTARFEDAKPNSDCSLEIWAHSAIVRLQGTIEEIKADRQIPGLLEATYEDHGVVSLEFVNDAAAAQFIEDYPPSVEYEQLTRDQQTDVENNRTLRNAEANEGKSQWKYAVGTEFVWSTDANEEMKISRRLRNEDGSLCYAVIHQRRSLRVVGVVNEVSIEDEPSWVLKNLLTATDEDHSVVTLTRDQQADVENNRTLRNAEANERMDRPSFKYSVGSVMQARSGFPALPIRHRLVSEDGHKWYFLGDSLDRATVSELALDTEWECISKSNDGSWLYKIDTRFDRRAHSTYSAEWLAVIGRVSLESGAPAYIMSSPAGTKLVAETELTSNYIVHR